MTETVDTTGRLLSDSPDRKLKPGAAARSTTMRHSSRGLHRQLVNEVGRAIVAGETPPGGTIDPDALAADSDVSRTVVRETLRVLADKGLLDARPRRGTFVLDKNSWNLLDPDVLRWQFETLSNPDVLEQLHEVRVMVEPAAAELAARRRTPEDLATLEDAIRRMAESDDAAAAIVEADLQFHLGLIAATHNDLVRQLGLVIQTGLAARDRYVHTHRISIRQALQVHRDVADAVAAGDARSAHEAMLRLLQKAADDARRASQSESSG